MPGNQSFAYKPYWFFYPFLSSLILAGILGACNHISEATRTIPPFSTQPSSQPPAATLLDNNPGPLPADNNSAGINLTQDSRIPPIPPGQFTVVSTQDCPELNWQGTGSDIIVSYKIYRRQINTKIWDLIATVPMIGYNRGSYTFCDKAIEYQLSFNYEYAVSAQDHYGNESELSEPQAVK